VSRFVLDASVALAWFIDHPVDAYAVEVREKIRRGDRAVVPPALGDRIRKRSADGRTTQADDRFGRRRMHGGNGPVAIDEH